MGVILGARKAMLLPASRSQNAATTLFRLNKNSREGVARLLKRYIDFWKLVAQSVLYTPSLISLQLL